MHDQHAHINAQSQVAFIGTGIMGAPIAKHILDAGYDLTVFNRSKDKMATLVDAGAHEASSIASAVENADVVFTMLGYPTDVEDAYLATAGTVSYTHLTLPTN